MKSITPRRALSKAYLKAPVSRPEIEQFKAAFVTMQEKIDPDETEEHLKNDIRDFLLDAYYKGGYEINVKDRKDLVIHNGPKTSDPVGVIIEAKSIKNTAEMVTKTDLNKKALRELILYYLREREDEQNISLKHLIITNATEWFVFDATQWEKLVYRDVKLLKAYKAYKLSGQDTRHFYDAIAKPHIEKIQDDLEYTYFDISKYNNIITNDDLDDDKKLVALFKLLSPTHMLKQSFSNDSNSLNKNFYNELLHIIGLEEVSDKGKKIIRRKSEDKREDASLIENTIHQLQAVTQVREAARYETALELCITWVNRVLFLKLLESQLVTYNKGDQSYRFLDFGRIANYDALNKLFFQVLAVKPGGRRTQVQEEYSKVPYLNSSLFEVSPVESKTPMLISGLEDDGDLDIYSQTVLKGEKGKRRKGKMATLAYLFEFLEAYNFSSEGGEQIQEESKTLINASVLGLIFEKINGYKDGSFFTPGFITMYMCRETIRRSVLQKFREQTDYDSEDWDELRSYIGRPYKKEDLQRYNALIDSIKICDPAVGSGHFLVSALNEMIAIKSELGILWDGSATKLPVLATIDNDELILENDDADHELYEYDYRSKESQRVQQAVFHEKKKLIESCLFGVDINPNSVKICRLRLWIELLKNAYYTSESNYTDLETLPNIDINIKCGNSLISRFDLESDLKPALKKSKFSIDSYKAAVQSYKGATDKEQKREFKELIKTIKGDFKSEVANKDKLALQKLEGEFYQRFGGATLLDVELSKTEQKKKAKAQKVLVAKIEKKKTELEEIQNNKIYDNAFEWRFEFPEVLDDEGEYVGFDVVIGNPPYIRQEEFSEIKSYLKSNFTTYKGTADLYVYFVERAFMVAADGAQFVYIIPNKWMRAGYGSEVRSYLKNQNLLGIYDFGDLPVFEEATTYPCILLAEKSVPTATMLAAEVSTLDYEVDLDTYLKAAQFEVAVDKLNDTGWSLTRPEVQQLLEKIKSKGVPLGEYVDGKIYRGVLTGLNEAFVIDEETKDRLIAEDPKSAEVIKPFLGGRDIKRYESPQAGKWLLFIPWHFPLHKDDSISGSSLVAEKAFHQGYAAVYNHLLKYKSKLEKRNKAETGIRYEWYALQRCAATYYEEFSSFKIVWPETSLDSQFALISEGIFLNKTCFMISNAELPLLAILNSNVAKFFYDQTVSKVRGGYFSMSRIYVEKFPILIDNDLRLRSLVTQIIALKKEGQPTEHLEAEIDVLVYKLYELTYAEVLIVDPEFGLTEEEYETT